MDSKIRILSWILGISVVISLIVGVWYLIQYLKANEGSSTNQTPQTSTVVPIQMTKNGKILTSNYSVDTDDAVLYVWIGDGNESVPLTANRSALKSWIVNGINVFKLKYTPNPSLTIDQSSFSDRVRGFVAYPTPFGID